MGQAPSRWSSVRGPIRRCNASLASHRLDPGFQGQQYPLTCFSPAYVQQKMQQTGSSSLESELLASLVTQAP
eukprot:1963023-Pyramimonas_sp.AAC.1